QFGEKGHDRKLEKSGAGDSMQVTGGDIDLGLSSARKSTQAMQDFRFEQGERWCAWRTIVPARNRSAADLTIQRTVLVDTLELSDLRLLLRVQRQQLGSFAVEQMSLVRYVIDVLLLEAIEHELGHIGIRQLLTHDALAVEHGEGGDHRHEVAPRAPENVTRFGRNHDRLLGLTRLLMLAPGVLVEHLIPQHPQTTEQWHDPPRQPVARQFA